MAIAGLLTVLAFAGIISGVVLGHSRTLSCYLAAVGGGLLLGISLFWLMPEIAETSGWVAALLMTAAAGAALASLDRLFVHSHGQAGQASLTPLLIATALHSFVDGWSVRALEAQGVAPVAAPLGLSLHKIPEGLALGWIARRSLGSAAKAAVAGAAVESFTLLGAYVEPHANRSGIEAFGIWWTAAIIAVISGSFLFLGLHAVMPNWRRSGAMAVFAATLLLVGTFGLLHR